MLHIETIRNPQQLSALRAEWDCLQRACGRPSAFLSCDWFMVCAASLRPGQELLLLVLRKGGALVGIAPLMRTEARVRGLRVRRIEFLGNEISPFADFLLLNPAELLPAIIGHLQDQEKHWDVLRFAGLKEDSAALILATDGFASGVSAEVPYLPLTTTWDDFYNGKSRKFRMTRRSIQNRIHRLEGIEIQHLTSVDDAARGLAALLDVSARGWKRQENADLLDEAWEKNFFTDLTRVAAERGWLHIWLLMQAGKPIAAEYHLQSGGTVYGLRAQYDNEFSFYSPGAYLDFEIVKHLHGAGIETYDMGPGAVPYKLAWTETMYPLRALELYNDTMYARAVNALQNSVIPAVKRTAVGRQLQRLMDGGV